MSQVPKAKQSSSLTKEEASALFLQHYDYVRSVAYRTAPAHGLQDDIAHTVFIEFVENASKWTIVNGQAKPLLRQITKNISMQFWREHLRHKPEHLRKLLEAVWQESPESTMREESRLQNQISILRVCLEKLSERNRQIVELFYYVGVSYEELVAKTGRTIATLYSLMTQIRTVLHDCVAKTLKLELDDE